ncbi:MAG TPA: hypothetical protein VFD92_19615 [Candidatus Binatia bacterium]|nr:hypothetical protein [Candidatus Binatia bacterium]
MRSAPRAPFQAESARRIAAGGLAALALAAVVASACRSADPKEDLKERARQYLELKQKRQWTAIYEGLLDPETRKTVKLEDFLRPRKETMDVLGFEVLSTDVADGSGSVKAKMDVVIPVLSPRGGTTMIRKELQDSQQWVRRDGRWYIQLRG